MSCKQDSFKKLPAVGRTSGSGAVHWDLKGCTNIRQILVSYSSTTYQNVGFSSCQLNGLQFQYVVKSGGSDSLAMSGVFGNMSGTSFKLIKLDYPREYITAVIIYSSATGIAFRTNLGSQHGPFPGNAMHPGCYDFGKDNQFGGLHGIADSPGICSLGVYVRIDNSLNHTSDQTNNVESESEFEFEPE